MLKLDAPGLAEKVAIGNAVVSVCGQECAYSVTESSDSTLACTVPAIATTKSNQLFKIKEEETLRANPSRTTFGTNVDLVLDGNELPAIQYNSGENCELGIKFAKDYVGELNELGIFMDWFDEGLIIDNLKLEGSNDDFST